jgi:hypothetical protein
VYEKLATISIPSIFFDMKNIIMQLMMIVIKPSRMTFEPPSKEIINTALR